MSKNNIINAISIAVIGIFIATSSNAKDSEPPEITYDGGQIFQNCVLDGGTSKRNGSSTSCTINGKTSTCDNDNADKNAHCTTQIGSRKSFQRHKLGHKSSLNFAPVN
ncbi:hypothetical protein [Ahrensia kielensis]|uniref:hypothetical protein n=1 Tax=Ahrensia kielensis TaxID=76980 RepID=UPI000381FB3D|nr:hypothetical protein [Ahrensia kielensis]